MGKLHEVLAVYGDLRSQAESCRADLKETFKKKTQHFTEKLVTFVPDEEGKPSVTESQLKLQTTVRDELLWMKEKSAKMIDAGHQIDTGNTVASADVILEDGTVMLKACPLTSLLRIQHAISEFRELVNNIPTLDPSKGFESDHTRGPGIYKAADESKVRTETKIEHVVTIQPTKEHPGQTAKDSVVKRIGIIHTQEWSSALTVADKARILDRIEMLARAIKKARSKANEIDLPPIQHIGDKLLSYVIGDAGA